MSQHPKKPNSLNRSKSRRQRGNQKSTDNNKHLIRPPTHLGHSASRHQDYSAVALSRNPYEDQSLYQDVNNHTQCINLNHAENKQYQQGYKQSKPKTENSLSNKKVKSRKNTSKTKNNKKSMKQSVISNHLQSKSAERKQSIYILNGDYAADIDCKIKQLCKCMQQIAWPNLCDSKAIKQYFQNIRDTIQTVSEPIYSLCCYMHQIYQGPILAILEAISPYENLLNQKRQLTEKIESQIRQNQKLFTSLNPTQLQILKLQDQIEQQRLLLQKRKHQNTVVPNKNIVDNSKNHHNYKILKTSPNQQNNSSKEIIKTSILRESEEQENSKEVQYYRPSFENQKLIDESKITRNDEIAKESSQPFIMKKGKREIQIEIEEPIYQQKTPISDTAPFLKGFKLNLEGMSRAPLGFHDEFYSKISEFSDSWREQAMRQKRF